ncbi:MAG TPA: hypothetical protein VER33_17510 [Polyangiaceae bacterium]|nr:hypothetical protein [Polyangiaceae bacterium]
MTHDARDKLAERLFAAARGEPPPAGAERRALVLAERELTPAGALPSRSRALSRSLLVAAALGGAGAAMLAVQTKEPTEVIVAEPTSSFRSVRAPATEAPPDVGAATSAPASGTARAPTATAVDVPTRARAVATLSDELELLKLAERSLAAGDARGALGALDRYDRALRGQKLQAEAQVLRMEALSAAGQHAAAAELAQRFVQRNPTSPLVDRARSFTQTLNPSPAGTSHERRQR